MKGIKQQIEEVETYNYNAKLSIKELEKVLKNVDDNYKKQIEEKNIRIKNNIKAVNKKAKELNKEVPLELLATIYSNIPRGIEFFEKYKEWFK